MTLVRGQGRILMRDGTAIPAENWQLIENFKESMEKERMETCNRCQERWFNMKLAVAGVCNRCRKTRDEDKQPYLMSNDNDMDPGEVPPHLPKLSQVQEMLIARAHVHVEAKRIRGHQYQYTGPGILSVS